MWYNLIEDRKEWAEENTPSRMSCSVFYACKRLKGYFIENMRMEHEKG